MDLLGVQSPKGEILVIRNASKKPKFGVFEKVKRVRRVEKNIDKWTFEE